MRDLYRRLLIVAVLFSPSALLGAGPLPLITPEQLQLLKQLPPAQRDLLRKALKDDDSATKPQDEDALPSAVEEKPAPGTEAERTSERIVRLQAGDTLLISFQPIKESEGDVKRDKESELPASAEEQAAQLTRRREEERLRQALLPSDPVYVLDQFGALTLNNIGRIVLAGLNETEAGERIEAERALRGLRVRVKRLPIEPELKRFGYDVFAGKPKRFAPALDVPVPTDYVIGPGDNVLVQLVGKENAEHDLVVTRDGMLLFPEIGPIAVAGMKFTQLQSELNRRVERQLLGTRASVTLGRLRSIRVFVLGEVEHPGSYVVSSFATLTNALLAGGGVKPSGSLRDVQLKREGKTVVHFDLYDLLLNGDARGDAALLPGDVIFVPPVGSVVGVGGRVQRPAFYELKSEKYVDDLVRMAGGLLPDAYPQAGRIDRIDTHGVRSVVNVDLTRAEARTAAVQNGDVLRVFAAPDRVEQSVRLTGWVLRPGNYQWHDGMRLTDLISSLDGLRPEADIHYVLIRRERTDDRQLELLGANPARALKQPKSAEDPALLAQDEVRVFSVHEDRASLVKPLLDTARISASPDRPAREVGLDGAVHHPGRYPWSPEMTVRDLIDAGGGLNERAYTLEAELTRYVLADGQPRRPTRQVLRLGTDLDLRLQPYDQIVIRRVPQWDEEGVVEILGEVRFPGRYPIGRGERLSEVLARAGGLSESAYGPGAIFLRESVRQREQEYIDRLSSQLERDLLVVKTAGPDVGVHKETAVLEGEALLRQLRATRATGRMVIKLDDVVASRGDYDIVMQPGDKLVIPQRPDEVTVIGEVYYPTSHVYAKNQSRDDYVRRSGGITERGDKRAVYVVHADGSVAPPTGWFSGDVAMSPGDTVIVPVKVDRIGNLKLATDITTILYQLAVTAAALHVTGVL
ncbi:MAG: SLBB domain-containing protein [Sulfurifustis sp.]